MTWLGWCLVALVLAQESVGVVPPASVPGCHLGSAPSGGSDPPEVRSRGWPRGRPFG